MCLGSNFLYYLDTTSCDWDLEASTTGTDTYFWIVCPGFLLIKLLVRCLYTSVTAKSDTECWHFNFYLQIWKFPI